MPKLLDHVRLALRTRHHSIRTESELDQKQIRTCLTHLAVKRKVAASTRNQALSAILFLYRDALNLTLNWIDDIERAKKPARLPVVFSREEVQASAGKPQRGDLAHGSFALWLWTTIDGMRSITY